LGGDFVARITDRLSTSGEELFTRRSFMKLLTLGALSAAMLPLTGCLFVGMGRDMLALRLLSEKYDRKFRIVEKTYYYNTSSIPEVYCSAENEDDLVFSLEFDVHEEKIVRDTYVGRKLGHQVENIITECFAEQGMNTVSLGDAKTTRLGDNSIDEIDPDITLKDFLAKYLEIKISISIFIEGKTDNLRYSPQLAEVMTQVYEQLGNPVSRMRLYVIKPEDLRICSEYLKTISHFYSVSSVPGVEFIDSFSYRVFESQIEID
jgi:hypothetical protein